MIVLFIFLCRIFCNYDSTGKSLRHVSHSLKRRENVLQTSFVHKDKIDCELL